MEDTEIENKFSLNLEPFTICNGKFPIWKLKWDLQRTSVTAYPIHKQAFSTPVIYNLSCTGGILLLSLQGCSAPLAQQMVMGNFPFQFENVKIPYYCCRGHWVKGHSNSKNLRVN